MSQLLNLAGSIIVVAGLLAAIILGSNSDTFSWIVATPYIIATAISALLFYALASIVDRLNAIHKHLGITEQQESTQSQQISK